MHFKQILHTDVLVIGSGGAGLCAAISAKEEGTDVLVVSKGKPGKANNTAISGGTFAVATGLKSAEDKPKLHVQDTLTAGRHINRVEMVRTMVDGAGEQTQKLIRYGVALKRKGETFWVVHVPGHTVPRHLFSENTFGSDFTIPLSKYAKNQGVTFLSGVFVERLCRDANGDIAGALILDQKRGEALLVQAKAIVLAAGGAGQIYSQNNNAPGSTGDGYALAFRLGVPFIDMEFVQNYPTLLFEPSLPRRMVGYEILVFRGGAKLLNSKEEDITLRHGMDNPDSMTRDALTTAIAKEIDQGRGISGGVWIDLSTIPSQKLERYHKFIPKSVKGRLRFVVSPAVHHFMGGLSVSRNGETRIKGLYAAGEVNGGVHGANRLGGNALTEAWVFGNLTGTLAAQYAKKKKQPLIEEDLEAVDKAISRNLEKKGDLSVQDIQKKLRTLMWEKAGIVRTEHKLSELVGTIENLKQQLTECRARDWRELIKQFETKNMLLVGEAVAKSAIFRKESRGSHYREDFPKEDGDGWIKNTLIQAVGRNMKITAEPCSSADD